MTRFTLNFGDATAVVRVIKSRYAAIITLFQLVKSASTICLLICQIFVGFKGVSMNTDTVPKSGWGQRLSWLSFVLSIGGLLSALVAAAGSGADFWSFGTGFFILRYAFYAAIVGGLGAVLALIISYRTGVSTLRLNVISFVVAAAFVFYLSNQISTAKSVPAIHDVATNLDDLPQFQTLIVRADNLDGVPDDGRPDLAALKPDDRWKQIHREAYGDIRTVRIPAPPESALQQIEALVADRGWQVAKVDRQAGTIEATDTTFFFRFKDDVIVRVRADPARPGASLIDMRSISRVGGSDVGVNAKRIRAFFRDLQKG